MYNTREAAAYSGHLPQAGVTPQLLDLLAMQKVDADKKAAAQQMAIQAGQANMPTVAQGLEQQALNSARGEIAQKLGLAGLAQQQAPQGPAPQQPPAQGLENAPSPLPQTYQEGGIVAFAGPTGSKVKNPDAGPPVMDPEALAFEQRQIARIDSEQNLNPETLAAAREARYDERIGKNNLAAIENQKARTAGIQALYDRQVAERPSSFMRGLQLMGKNTRGIGLGGAFEGVSEGIDKTNAGYTTQEIANQTAIDALNVAMEKAIRENDLGGYNAAVAGLDEAKARIADAGKQGTQVMDVNRRTQTQKETNYTTVEGRKAEMAMRVREINARAAEAAQVRSDTASRLAFENDQKQAMTLALKAADTEKNAVQNAGKYDGVSVEELALPLYQKFLAELTAKPGAPRATAPTIAPPPPGAVRLKQKG